MAKMDKASSSSGLPRTQSNQLAETVVAAMKSPAMSEAVLGLETDGTPSRKLSKRSPEGAGRGGGGSSSNIVGGSRSNRIRKSRSAQMKVELDDLSSGAALSRASSASLGLSFSFTGFVPPDDIADLRPFSDNDEIRECFNCLRFL